MKPLLSLLIIGVVVLTMVGPSVASAGGVYAHGSSEHGSTEHGTSQEHHGDGAPCSDGDEHGPGDKGCLCLCCPGHANFLLVAPVELVHSVQVSTQLFIFSPHALPMGVSPQVFRPPRI